MIAIDADLLVYQVGFACQQHLDWGDGWASPVADSKEADARLLSKVKAYRKRFGKKDIVFCLSDPDSNFRKGVLPSYKGNRQGAYSKPLLFSFIREWFMQHGRVECWDNLEADDVMGILATREGATMVTIDKDLCTIPGTVVNPETWVSVEIEPEEARAFHLYQTLTGDSVDNYKGCPGVGPVNAARLLDAEPTWETVVGAYKEAGLTEEDALVQARCAYILRDGDYNHETGEVKLWTPTK